MRYFKFLLIIFNLVIVQNSNIFGQLNCSVASTTYVVNCSSANEPIEVCRTTNFTVSENYESQYCFGANVHTGNEDIGLINVGEPNTTSTVIVELSDFSGDLDLFALESCNSINCISSSTSSSATMETIQFDVFGEKEIFLVVDGKSGNNSNYRMTIDVNVNNNPNSNGINSITEELLNHESNPALCNDDFPISGGLATISVSLGIESYWFFPEGVFFDLKAGAQIYKIETNTLGDIIVDIPQSDSPVQTFIYQKESITNGTACGNPVTSDCYVCKAHGTNLTNAIFENAEPDTYFIIVDGVGEANFTIDVDFNGCGNLDCECEYFLESGISLICDGIEAYNDGSIASQSSIWSNFIGSSSTNSDAIVTSDFSFIGDKSLEFQRNNNSFSDVVLELGNQVEGIFRLDWKMFIESNAQPRLGILYDYTGNASTNDWAYRIYFEGNGQGNIYSGVNSNSSIESFSYQENEWLSIVQIFNLEEETVEFWIDNIFITSFDYNIGNPNSSLQIGDLNIWHGAGNNSFFIDALCFRQPDCGGAYDCDIVVDLPVCVNGEEFGWPCLATCKGYTENEWIEGECEDYSCNDCLDCFYYLFDKDNPQICDFYNNNCNLVMPSLAAESIATINYKWTVKQNGNTIFPYINTTNQFSENPKMEFPNTGTYEICQEIFDNNDKVYECCLIVHVPNIPCNAPPVCDLTVSETAPNFFTFTSTGSIGIDNYKWDFSSGASTTQVTTSSSFSCNIPPLGCYTVCLIGTNECGVSNYCVEICGDNEDCTSDYPNETPHIEPVINGTTVEFPYNLQTSWVSAEWTAVEASFINGTDASDYYPVLEYDTYGNYIVCLTLQKDDCTKICLCWTIPIPPPDNCDDNLCTSQPSYNCNDIDYFFTGLPNGFNLTYDFEFNGNLSSNDEICGWELYEGETVNGTLIPTNPSDYFFENGETYTVCYTYWDASEQCLKKCCKTIVVDNPYDCGNDRINCDLVGNGYQFSLIANAQSGSITWINDDTNQPISPFVPLPSASNCYTLNISVRYYDLNTNAWRICCKTILICPPVECDDNISCTVDVTTGQYIFSLNAASFDLTSISWQNDSNPNCDLPVDTPSFSYPQNCPIPCAPQTISVRYRDPVTNCWYICCKTIYLCAPDDCEDAINYYYNGTTIELELTANNIDENSIEWFNDTDNELIPNQANPRKTIPYPMLPPNCEDKWITVKYYDYDTECWYNCCRRIRFCEPLDCYENIDYQFINGEYELTFSGANVESGSISWINDATGSIIPNSGNEEVIYYPIPSNGCVAVPISVRYYDNSSDCWRICCRIIWICAPENCSNVIVFTDNGNGEGSLSLQTDYDSSLSINWTCENQSIGTIPEINIGLMAGETKEICVYYYDISSGCWYVCCRTITPSDNCEDDLCNGQPDYDCDDIQFVYTGDTSGTNITYDFTHSGMTSDDEFCGWELYEGTNATSGAIVSTNPDNYTFMIGNTYTVCYVYWDASEGCLKKCCKRIVVENPYECGNDIIQCAALSDSSGYQFSLNNNQLESITWFDDENGNQIGTGNSINKDYFLGDCDYFYVSVRYYNPSTGYWQICCKIVWLCPPSECEDNIVCQWDFVANKYKFSLQGVSIDNSSVSWQNDNTGDIFGIGEPTNVIYNYPLNCVTPQTISVRYRDADNQWYICCKTIYLCNPEECAADFDYYYNGTSIELTLNPTNIDLSSITWYDDTNGNDLATGSDPTTVVPVPSLPSEPGCFERWITVRYFSYDSNCWITCCRLIRFCNPEECSSVINFIDNFDGTGQLTLINTNYDDEQPIEWYCDNQSIEIDENTPISNLVVGQAKEICVYYYDIDSGCWYVCCRTITPDCNDLPPCEYNYTQNGLIVNFYAPTGGTTGNVSYQWDFGDGFMSNEINPTHTYAVEGNFTCCLTMTDDCNPNTCCQMIPVAPILPVVFCVAENICGNSGDTVSVPITVKNFVNITGFQMSIHIANGAIGMFNVADATANHILPSLSNGGFTLQPSNTTLTGTWFNNGIPVSLTDSTAIFTLEIVLNGDTDDCTDIFIDGNPTEFLAFNENIFSVPTATNSGSTCIKSQANISGNIRRAPPMGNNVAQVDVQLSGFLTDNFLTVNDGNYQFNDLASNQNYVVTPQKDINPRNGVNVGDILTIQKFINSQPGFLTSPYQQIAADVNGDSSINVADILFIQKLINTSISVFPNGTPSWKFVSSDYIFTTNNPVNEPFEQERIYSPLTNSLINQDFIGVKMGDVNDSADPVNLVSNAILSLSVGSVVSVEDSIATVKITADDFTNIAGIQLSIDWDSSIVSYQGVSGFGLLDLAESDFSYNEGSETLSLAWFTSGCETLEANSTLFEIQFLIIGENGQETDIEITSSPTEVAIFDCQIEQVSYSLNTGNVSIIDLPNLDSVLIQNLNCFGESTASIDLQITGGSGNFSILWNTGDTTQVINSLPTGTYSATITDLETGVIIETEEFSITEPTELIAQSTVENETNGESNGKLSLEISGGTTPYSYQWEHDANETSNQVCDLPNGIYTVTVLDANDCEIFLELIVDNVVATKEISQSKDINIFPNPASDYLMIELSENLGNEEIQSIEIYSLSGTLVSQQRALKKQANIYRCNLDVGLPVGTYLIKFKIGSDLFYERIVIYH